MTSRRKKLAEKQARNWVQRNLESQFRQVVDSSITIDFNRQPCQWPKLR